jgi:hypothetical protein
LPDDNLPDAPEAPQDVPAEGVQDGADASQDAPEAVGVDTPTPTPDEAADGDAAAQDTFPRDYVEQLRAEAKARRQEVADLTAHVDELQRALWSLQVEQDGRLADPSDLAYEPGGNVSEAITSLLESKPHYARRAAPLPEQTAADAAPAGPSFGDLLRTL